MAAILVPVNGEIVSWALAEADLTPEDVGDRLGVDENLVLSWIDGSSEPNKTQFDRLVALLDIPEGFFFLDRPPSATSPLPRLRRRHARDLAAIEGGTELKAIRLADSLQRVSRWVGEQQHREPVRMPRATVGEPTEEYAAVLTEWLTWDVHEQQLLAERQTAKLMRAHIEDKGVLALNLTLGDGGFRGFGFPDDLAPLVAINTRDDHRTRLASYVHELGHIALEEPSLCFIGSETHNEQWCDAVSRAVLMPSFAVRRYIRNSYGTDMVESAEQLKQTANRFRATYRMAATRLEELGLVPPGFQHRTDLPAMPARRTGGRGALPQTRARKRLKRYGHAYVAQLIDAERTGDLTAADLTDLLDLSRSELRELRSIAGEGAKG